MPEEQLRLPFMDPDPVPQPYIMCGDCGRLVQKGNKSWAYFGVCEGCYQAAMAQGAVKLGGEE